MYATLLWTSFNNLTKSALILLHGVISLTDATSCDNLFYIFEFQKSTAGIVPPFSMGNMLPSIGGLPIDFANALIHPAFPTPMMMQPGGFPTPFQLQQMIQGQVAASFPLIRPEGIHNPMQLFQPAFSVPSTMSVNNHVKTESKR